MNRGIPLALVILLLLAIAVITLPMPNLPKNMEKCKIFDEVDYYYVACGLGATKVDKPGKDIDNFLKAMVFIGRDDITRFEIFKDNDGTIKCRMVTVDGKGFIMPLQYCVEMAYIGRVRIYAEKGIFERSIPPGPKNL